MNIIREILLFAATGIGAVVGWVAINVALDWWSNRA